MNKQKLDLLPGQVKPFTATKEHWPDEWRTKPVPDKVELKVDAQVLVCANGAGPGLVNGSVGKVVRFDDEEVVIVSNGVEIPVRKYSWEFPIWKWNGREMIESGRAVYTQMPLKLAWAMTIHKAQGQTVEGPMWLDLGNGIWSGGQTYVALSRVRKLDQIHLRRDLGNRDILVEKEALAFASESDTPLSIEEIREKAASIYRETTKIKQAASEERRLAEMAREEVANLTQKAIQAVNETLRLVEGMRSAEAAAQRAAERAEAVEKRLDAALNRARSAGWLARLLGRF
jgi:hypothetical protein